MDRAAHTPGPWRANNYLIEGPRLALAIATVCAPHLGNAARDVAEAKANARLIAAAPDMLAALRAIADRSENGELGTSKVVNMRNLALAAIAKAEGRTDV